MKRIAWLLLCAASAFAWPNGYAYRRTVTINSNQAPSPQTDFPVLISGTYSYLASAENGGKVQSVSGASPYDLIFTADPAGANLLAWEIEFWDPATGSLQAWVKWPTLSNGACIYLFYGRASVTSFQSANSVWDTYYRTVLHMKENPTGAAPQIKDSTAFNNSASVSNTPAAWVSGQQTPGKIDGSLTFDRVNGRYLTLGGINLTNAAGVTISMWIKPVTPWAGYADLLMAGGAAGLYFKDNFRLGWWGSKESTNTTGLSAGSWYYVALTWTNATSGAFYLNGVPDGVFSDSHTLTVNRVGSDASNQEFKGQIDEARVSVGIGRSADWILTEYRNQSAPDAFLAIGSEDAEQRQQGGAMILGE